MDKVVLNESEQREIDLITEEFRARGGMDDEELISRLGAIPFEEFMNIINSISNKNLFISLLNSFNKKYLFNYSINTSLSKITDENLY